jgi:hypothetical protein
LFKKSLLRLSIRARTRLAKRWLERIRLSHWEILEIRYQGGELARSFLRPHSEAVPRKLWEKADLLVFLDLADQSQPDHFAKFLASVPTKRILFSFSESTPKLPTPAITTYPQEEIYRLLKNNGFQRCEIRPLNWIWGTKLVFAERPGFQVR